MSNFPPISSPTDPPGPLPPGYDGIDYPALVQAQKWVIWSVLANILTIVLIVVAASMAASANRGAANSMLAFINLGRVAIAIGSALALWNLAKTLRYGVPWLLGLLTLIPCIGLITLLVVNANATSRLQAAGYQVGLMGAKPR